MKHGQRDVETLFIDDLPELLSPIAVPDFDINTLMWDGQRMTNWTDPQADITPIIEHIKNRQAVMLGDLPYYPVPQDRIDKITRKGYTIINPPIPEYQGIPPPPWYS